MPRSLRRGRRGRSWLAEPGRSLSFSLATEHPAAPVVPQLVPDQALRRTAWRLAALADAILDEEGKTGVAALLSGEDQENSKAYADLYREQALAIDAARTDDALLAAVAMIRPEEELPVAADAPAVKPAATAPESDPFGGK